jgi:hypothetical protein
MATKTKAKKTAKAFLSEQMFAAVEKVIEDGFGRVECFADHDDETLVSVRIIPGASVPSIAAELSPLGLDVVAIAGDEFGRLLVVNAGGRS